MTGAEGGGPWTEEGLLEALRGEGAHRLERVRFRSNRSTIWSVTAGGSVLNLHEGYRTAPWTCLRRFEPLVSRSGRSRGSLRAAAAAVRSWPGLLPAVRRARRGPRPAPSAARRPVRPGPCSATPEQRAQLGELYARLNRERFQGLLPADLHLRLSRRMRSRLGHMRGHVRAGRRYVIEIALSADLMLEGNGPAREETLVHEMAHAADWLIHGGRGHGATWKAWAVHAGCEPRASTRSAVVRPGRGRADGRSSPPAAFPID